MYIKISDIVIPRVCCMSHEVCYHVQDDVMSAEDVDKVMTHGLGTRYAFIGPFMTAHLNAEGNTTILVLKGPLFNPDSNGRGNVVI